MVECPVRLNSFQYDTQSKRQHRGKIFLYLKVCAIETHGLEKLIFHV